MSLTLYYHPLSSFCWKALIALYENAVPFTPHLVDLSDATQRADFLALWPIGKFPVLRDETRGVTVAESSILIEYLGQYCPGPVSLIPADPEVALQVRARDRFLDLHVHMQVQAIVADALRPERQQDPYGVEDARSRLETALALLDKDIGASTWAAGEAFSLADCAAVPAVFYANEVAPFGAKHTHVAAYLKQALTRPSVARVVDEAKPFFHLFPKDRLTAAA